MISQIRNILGVGVGLGATESVIKMSYVQFRTQLFLPLRQNMKQTHRVGTPRHGHHQPFARRNKTVLPNKANDSLSHSLLFLSQVQPPRR